MKNKNKNKNSGGNNATAKKSKFKEKLEMYDMILANLYAGSSIIEPDTKLDNSQIAIGFSTIASETQISKYFCINEFPDYLKDKFIDNIRSSCMNNGIKINFYFDCSPYRINWDSMEMRNRMAIWSRFADENDGSINVFNYREDRESALARDRIVKSTMYLHESELEHKRALARVSFIIEITAKRDEESIVNMTESIRLLKDVCASSSIKLRELRINMIDWIRLIHPFSLKASKETEKKIAKKILTDDILANLNSYSQGRVGLKGIPLGIDILSYSAVLRQFKEDPDKAENWLVSAETGGGKSLWAKSLLPYFMAVGYTVVVMDYEGDEYTNFANFVRESNPDDVKVVSMGKGSAVYFDPCEIPELTGDPKVDDDLKEGSISFIMAIYRIMVHGMDEDFTTEERKIITTAIQRMYDSAGVTDDKSTWYRSKELRLHDVYNEIKEMVNTKEFVDGDNDNLKHKAAIFMLDACSSYFEEGEANYSMFSNPISANELYKAQLIVFSFGMRGISDSASDPVILALKQLSIAYVNVQISNYCKYVKHTFNVKIWEEFQRWGTSKGSAGVIAQSITGGRKRGDINFIITNDLGEMIRDDNELTNKLADNIQNYSIGKIKSNKTREKFCQRFDLMECKDALDKIAKASLKTKIIRNKENTNKNKYQHSFCVITDDGNKAIVKSMLPASILMSNLFRTGVQIK